MLPGALAGTRVFRQIGIVIAGIGCELEILSLSGDFELLHRSVDKAGRAIDLLLSKRHDMDAAKPFSSGAT
jgi:hypothetical protein